MFFELLIQHGANVDCADNDLKTPLCVAASNCGTKIVDILIKMGNKINYTDSEGKSPLFYASSYGKIEVVKMLIERGAHVNIQANNGDTPMHMAGYKARVDVMKKLLSHGADINAVNDKGETPLYVCIKQENLATQEQKLLAVQYLLEQGASIEVNAEINIIELPSQYLPDAVECLQHHYSIPSIEDIGLLGVNMADESI